MKNLRVVPTEFTPPPAHPEARELFYGRIIIPLCELYMRYIQRLHVVCYHPERVPLDSGAMLALNHTSYWDFVYGGIPAWTNGNRLTRFMAKKEIFDVTGVGMMMRWMKHISVDRVAGQAAVEEATERARGGDLIAIFPEGTISRSFEVKELRQGAAIIARDAHVPLIPVILWGGHRMWTKGRKPTHRPDPYATLAVSVGEPVEVSDDPIATTERLHAAMVELMDETRRRFEEEFGPMPKGEFWVPAALGGSAPTLEDATAEDRRIHAERKAAAAARAADPAAHRRPGPLGRVVGTVRGIVDIPLTLARKLRGQ